MSKKFAVLSAAMISMAFVTAGFALAADGKHKELEEVMEKIQKNTNSIRKATRTAAAWKKDGGNVAKEATEIEELGKKARKVTGPATELKKPIAEWEKLNDDMIKAAANLASLAKKSGTTQVQAKEAFNAVNKSCTACHNIYRVEDEN